jgi:hypothetical protein
MKADDIIKGLEKVTKGWAKQRRAEERNRAAEANRASFLMGRARDSMKDIAYDIMRDVYNKVSDNGRLPALARQLMYAARPIIQKRTGRPLGDKYFTQTLLPDYMRDHPGICADWKVVYDARGHLREPHTNRGVPLGTLDVRGYINLSASYKVEPPTYHNDWKHYPTVGPKNRYGDILFIEKEGFMPLFDAVELDKRHDIAIMSTKGMSVTASRELVDEICTTVGKVATDRPVRLLVLHDFDKSGFSIVGTLQRETRRWAYKNEVSVVDVGMRLADIEGLQSEEVFVEKRSAARQNLRLNGAKDDEIEFLFPSNHSHDPKRVELNAFTSDGLVTWIEKKLKEHGVKKVIPDDATLADAFRRTHEQMTVQKKVDELVAALRKDARAVDVPADLRVHIESALVEEPVKSWDAIIARIVKKGFAA